MVVCRSPAAGHPATPRRLDIVPTPTRDATPEVPVTAFSDWFDAFLAEYLRLEPVSATHIGEHAHDDRWSDRSADARAARLAFIERNRAELEAFPAADLEPDERIDRDVLLGTLAAEAWEVTAFREPAWNPLVWIYDLGDGIFPLLARDFAPLAVRLASATGRLEALPTVVDEAIEQLGSDPERRVPRLHAETAVRDLPGVTELVGEAVEAGEAGAAGDPAVAALLPRLRAAAETARAALDRFATHLAEVIVPASEGDGRIGRELFEARLAHTLQCPTPTAVEIRAAAELEFAALRAEMTRLARDLWAAWIPDRPLPTPATHGTDAAAEQAIVREVIAAISADHPAADELLDVARADVAEIEAFCREHDLVGLADEPLTIQWTPGFLRSFAGAMLHAPGPLDRGQASFYSITPIGDDWPPERRASYLREYNRRQMRMLTIHEAVPGHFLQGAWSNHSSSLVRSVFGSGLYAEGWAVYVTQVMLDAGYAADDPAYALIHWKYYLRAVVNAILDQRVHIDGIGEDEAIELMVEGGFQEPAEARKKYDRARLTSTQLSTYFVGSMELWVIEREVRRRLAAASGDPRGAAAVEARDLPGGFGETPGFRYRDHLEAVLSHGEPPTSILRRILLDAP
jgi:uncharacterized protein (DUF885 family)